MYVPSDTSAPALVDRVRCDCEHGPRVRLDFISPKMSLIASVERVEARIVGDARAAPLHDRRCGSKRDPHVFSLSKRQKSVESSPRSA
jgi:hypothetical protein